MSAANPTTVITPKIAGRFFPNLHLHDDHSVKDGASSCESYADKVVELGGTSLAVTNHGQGAGWARQYFACEDRKIKPIFGMEAYINEIRLAPVREIVTSLRAKVKTKTPGDAASKLSRAEEVLRARFRPSRHAIILAKNHAGYRNLVRMSTDSWRRGFYYVPRTDTKFLAEHAEGLIYSTACIGGYIPKMAAVDYPAAVAEARRLMGIFRDGFYVELMVTGYSKQRDTNLLMMKLAHEIGAPTIVTCDVHYLNPGDSAAQSALLLMRDKKTIADSGGAGEGAWQFDAKQLYWRTLEDVMACWKEHHQEIPRDVFLRSIKETYALADSIEAVKFDTSLKLPGIFDNPDGLLRELVVKGYKDHQARSLVPALGKTSREYAERIQRELKVIESLSFSEYFLVLHDICDHARKIGARMGPGRGSAGGSLVAFLLRITEIDPLKFNLLFERFLDAGRKDAPDIDLDFSPEHRDGIKLYIEKKYPATATVGTFSTFKARATLKDVGAVFGVPRAETEKVTKPMGTEGDDKTWDEILELYPDVAAWAKKYPKAWEVASTLRGLISHRGKHAAAMLIAPASALDDIPLMLGPQGVATDGMVTAFPDTQGDGVKYKGRELTRLGCLKMDILGVRNLNVVPRALEIMARDEGITIDIEKLPLDDPAALEIATSGDVPGVFQFDTPVTRPIMRLVGIDSFFDLAIVTSLARPGPLENGLPEKFAAAKSLGEGWREKVPEILHDVLGPSRGLMVFQEDVMFTLQRLGGFTMQESNAIRKAIGKKLDPEVLEEYRSKFVDGGVKLGHVRKTLDDLFSTLAAYCKYAFNASHAVAYSLTAYRQLFILAHHPLAYFAASLAETPRGEKGYRGEPMVDLMRAAMARGVSVLPPSLERSQVEFDVDEGAIRYGLAKIKGVANAAEAIIEARQGGGAWSFEDFIARLDRKRANSKVVQSLILAGAMDGMLLDDAALRADVPHIDLDLDDPIERRNHFLIRYAYLTRKSQKKPPDLPKLHLPSGLLDAERELLGMALSWWSSNKKEDIRTGIGLFTIADALSLDRVRFSVLGEVTRARAITTKKKKSMAFLTIADETGVLDNITIWPDQWGNYGAKLRVGRIGVFHFQRKKTENPQYGEFSYYFDDYHRGEPVEAASTVLERLRVQGADV